MALMNILGVAAWAIQAIFAIAVLGLSVDLMNRQYFGNPPTSTVYSVFTGAFGLIIAVVGIIAMFIEKIPTIAVMVLDGLSNLFFLAAGIAFSVGLGNISCGKGNKADIDRNYLLNEGVDDKDLYRGIWRHEDQAAAGRENCRHARGIQGLQFATFIVGCVTLFLSFLVWRNRRGSSGRAVV